LTLKPTHRQYCCNSDDSRRSHCLFADRYHFLPPSLKHLKDRLFGISYAHRAGDL
jgi:hypothetical protein